MKLGSTTAGAIKLGSIDVSKMMLGSTELWSTGSGLAWPPPEGWEGYTVRNVPTSGGLIVLDDYTDYRVVFPNEPVTATTVLRGGRNVVVIGGEIKIDDVTYTTAPGANEATQTGLRIFTSQASGAPANTGRIVHIEGLLMHGYYLSDGITTQAPEVDLRVQNCRVEQGMWYRDMGRDGVGSPHGDILQPYGGVGWLRVDGLTGLVTGQGLMLKPDFNEPNLGFMSFRRMNLRLQDNPNVEANDLGATWPQPSTNSGPRYFWWLDGEENDIYLDNGTVWFDHPTRNFSDSGTEMFWPESATYGTDGVGTYAIPKPSLSQSIRNWSAVPSAGKVYEGNPPGGDYVSDALAGLSYVSPGYDSGLQHAEPEDTTAPPAPTNVAATPGNQRNVLTWTDPAVGDLDGIRIYRSTTSGSGYTLIATVGQGVQFYTDDNLTNSTTYYYVLTAVDAVPNESATTAEVSGTPVAVDLYANLPGASGDLITTTDAAWQSNPNKIDISVFLTEPLAAPGGVEAIVSKFDTNGNQRGFFLALFSGGVPYLWWSSDGTNAQDESVNGVSVGDIGAAFRMTLELAGGNWTTTLYNTTDPASTDPASVSWTQLATNSGTATQTSIFDSSAPLAIGGLTSGGAAGNFTGGIERLTLRDASGTVVEDFYPTRDATEGTLPFVSRTSGAVWTPVGGSTFVEVAEAAEITIVDSSSQVAFAESVSATVPSTAQANDLVLVFAASSRWPILTTPGTFTSEFDQLSGSASADAHLVMYSGVVGVDCAANDVISVGNPGSGTGNNYGVAMVTLRASNGAVPQITHALDYLATPGDASPTAPSLSAATSGLLLFAAQAARSSTGNSQTPPGGYSELEDVNRAYVGLMVASKQVAAGATGTAASTADGGASAWVAAHVLLTA